MAGYPRALRGTPTVLAAIAAVLLYGGNTAAAELSVCIDASSPTAVMASRLAYAVARHEHSTVRVHWFDSAEGDEPYDMRAFRELADRQCQLVLGFPIDADAQEMDLGGLAATKPYGHTAFVLVTPKASTAPTLGALPEHTSVAVVYLTTPNVYFAEHPNLQADVTVTNDAAFKALTTHAVGAAMLWRPAVVRYLADHHLNQRFTIHELHEPHAMFNVVALYDRTHEQAADAFESAIDTMTASGELKRTLEPYVAPGAASSRSAVDKTDPDPPARGSGAPSAAPAAADSSDSSARPALYTEAQATSGRAKFLGNCSMCHGALLEGGVGPALKGEYFATAKNAYDVSDIFTIVSHNMPADQPGTLPQQTYVDIMAFLLQQNGYPAGNEALTYDKAMQSKVRFISKDE